MSARAKRIFLLVTFLFIESSQAQNITIGNCLKGVDCEPCSGGSVRWSKSGEAMCCAGCNKPPMIGTTSGYCICVAGSEEKASPRIIFEGSRHRYPSKKEVTKIPQLQTKYSVETLSRAITLMADAIEKIDLRLRKVEETLGQINLLKFGDVPISDHIQESNLASSIRCKANFVEVGTYCVFLSVFTNHRANWKDAHKTCERMGANLAEVVTHNQYLALSSYLASTSTTAGYSYWLGGLYPGAIWVWLSNGEKVTMNSHYWTSVRPVRTEGSNPATTVIAGDIENGRCLGFHYVMEKSSYKLAGDECGYEKFFACQTEKY